MVRLVALLAFGVSLFALASGSPAVPADPVPAKDDKKGGFEGRTKEGKARLLKEFGGSEEGEEAVMLGLAWLTQVQKKEGNWQYDAGHTTDRAAATGMAVLAFLGAGQSHKEGRYKQTVQAGLDWLVKDVTGGQGDDRGKFKSVLPHNYMYSQGIATLALCEAYGMTRDPALKPAAQAAIDFIQRAQGRNGSWGYTAGTQNDTSIVGWQIQALHAAMLTQELTVDPKVIKNAIKFLDFVSPGQTKATYGYTHSAEAQHATSRTAIGLLCRYYVDNWRPGRAGFAEGAQGLMKRAVTPDQRRQGVDLYYCYYATQVVCFYGGEDWRKWNEGAAGADGKRHGGLPDVLLALQTRTPGNRGSWGPETDSINRWFANGCGRLGTTCMCLLTLEVYYRYTPEQTEKGKEPMK